MKRSRKIIIIGIICLVMSFAVGGAYAYWAGVVNAPTPVTDDISIQIGEGASVNTELVINQGFTIGGRVLVPIGQVDNSNAGPGLIPVDSMTFPYHANWTGSGATGATGSLTITLGQITIGGTTTHAGLLKVYVGDTPGVNPLTTTYTFSNSIVVGTQFNFTLCVTLDCPSSTTVYDEIFSQPIVIPLTFSVAVT
ncbi:MAG TPA: hypothetical protein PK415_03875 [Bacilli bacterium]|jgi:hypothetical protein|nr:hypothetical protein [Bacilli bacterium]HQO94013.1 hypothetical protein [Bacilli bacterium]